MAADVGQFSIPASTTGNIDINIGLTPTYSDLYWQGSAILPGHGHQRGSDAWCFSDTGNGPANKYIRVKNTAGTLIIEGTVSYLTNKIRLNLTTNTSGSAIPVLAVFGN